VVLRAQTDVVRVFHPAKAGLDMMLGAVTAHDIGIAPVVVIGEQQR
jgi:hypothetical protein